MADERENGGQREPMEAKDWKIAKLRWLGLEREATDLAHARETRAPTGECVTEPVNTD